MVPRLSGQTSIFGVVRFVSKSLLGIERQNKLKKFTIFTRKPRSHVRILICRTWPIAVYVQHALNKGCSQVMVFVRTVDTEVLTCHNDRDFS